MVRNSLLFLVIALIATIEFVCGFAVLSVVPGWHTVIVPPFMALHIALIAWLYILSAAYFILEIKNSLPAQRTVFIHLTLTLFFFLYSNGENSFYNTANGFLWLIVPLGLFAIGQIIFIISFISRLNRVIQYNGRPPAGAS